MDAVTVVPALVFFILITTGAAFVASLFLAPPVFGVNIVEPDHPNGLPMATRRQMRIFHAFIVSSPVSVPLALVVAAGWLGYIVATGFWWGLQDGVAYIRRTHQERIRQRRESQEDTLRQARAMLR